MNIAEILTKEEIQEIADYTVQKINNYPAHFGKTVENYFDLLFPDEVSNFLMRREINRRGRENMERRRAVAT
jgi:hypothetical protein